MPETYTTLQAATALGVHVNTVRQWINEFADVLSAGARHRPRVLTAGDMATLHHVAQLRADNHSRAEILAMLRQMPTADRQAQVIDSASSTPASSPSPTAPAMDPTAILVDLATLVDVRTSTVSTQVQQLSDRVTALESRRLLYTGIAIGIAAGVLLGVVLARLLLLR